MSRNSFWKRSADRIYQFSLHVAEQGQSLGRQDPRVCVGRARAHQLTARDIDHASGALVGVIDGEHLLLRETGKSIIRSLGLHYAIRNSKSTWSYIPRLTPGRADDIFALDVDKIRNCDSNCWLDFLEVRVKRPNIVKIVVKLLRSRTPSATSSCPRDAHLIQLYGTKLDHRAPMRGAIGLQIDPMAS